MWPRGTAVAIARKKRNALKHVRDFVGMCASLIVLWDDYQMLDGWKTFTADGLFANHDAKHANTLYGAEVIVDPSLSITASAKSSTPLVEAWRNDWVCGEFARAHASATTTSIPAKLPPRITLFR